MNFELKLLFDKICSFFFFWKQDIENNTTGFDFFCFHSKELFKIFKKHFLIIFFKKKIVFITKNHFELNIIDKISFQKFFKIEIITMEGFLQKSKNNLFFKLNSTKKSKMGLGSIFFFFNQSLENFKVFEFFKKNFFLEDMSSLLKNFERRSSQKNIFWTIKLNFSLIFLIKKFLLTNISKNNNFCKKRKKDFLTKISKNIGLEFKNNSEKFFIFFEIKKNHFVFFDKKKIKKFGEKNGFTMSIFCNFFESNFLFLIEKTFLINPTIKQMIFYQLFIKLNNLFFQKFIIYDEKNFLKKDIAYFLHLFSENIKFKFFKILNFKKQKIIKERNKKIFGKLYNTREFFSKNFEKNKGVFEFSFSQVFFFSSRGFLISISFFFKKNLKKITFFLKKTKSLNQRAGPTNFMKLFEITNLLINLRRKNFPSFFNKKKSKKPFFQYSLKRLKNLKIAVSEKFLKSKQIFLNKKVDQLFFFSEKTCKNSFFWAIKKLTISKFSSFFFIEIEFFSMKLEKKDFYKQRIKKIYFITKKKFDSENFKSKIVKFKFLKKNWKNLNYKNLGFFSNKNSKKNISELKNIFYEKNKKGRKKKATVQLTQNHLCLIPEYENKNIEIFYQNIKYIFYEINFLLNLKIIHIHLSEDLEFKNLTNERNIQIFYEDYEAKINLVNGKKEESSNSEEKEFEEKFKIKKCTNQFNHFIKALAQISGKNIEIFNSDFGFFGIFEKKNLFFTPTKNCFVCLSDPNSVIIPFASIEIMYFERISPFTKNFDLVFVFKNFLKKDTKKEEKWIRISSIYHKSAPLINFFIKKFILECFYGNSNLNWKLIFEEAQKECDFFQSSKNWKVLLKNKEEDTSENTSLFDKTFQPDESLFQDLREKTNDFPISSITDELNWEDLH